MRHKNLLVGTFLLGCGVEGQAEALSFRMAPECPPGCVCVCEDPTTSGGASSGSSSGTTGPEGSTGAVSTGATETGANSTGAAESSSGGSSGGSQPAFDCPASIVNGVNQFSGAGLPTRDVYIQQYGSSGPLMVYWYGTNGSIANVLGVGSVGTTQAMAAQEGGIFVLPEADPAAITRPNDNIFPWWVVADPDEPLEEKDRQDDFLLMDAIVGCMAGQYDADRILTAGASAGGIMSTYLMAQRDYLAGAALWSGGTTFGEPMTPLGDVAAAIIHGGPRDEYCGTGVDTCYEFMTPSENLGADMVAAGNFAFLCDHGEQGGQRDSVNNHHTDAMANEGTEFLRLANRNGHPWVNYPFGPSLPNGSSWMLDNYCYSVGDVSPWDL